jgi:hypothetical protein
MDYSLYSNLVESIEVYDFFIKKIKYEGEFEQNKVVDM